MHTSNNVEEGSYRGDQRVCAVHKFITNLQYGLYVIREKEERITIQCSLVRTPEYVSSVISVDQ